MEIHWNLLKINRNQPESIIINENPKSAQTTRIAAKENPKLRIPKSSTTISLAKTMKTILPVYTCNKELTNDQSIFFETVAILFFCQFYFQFLLVYNLLSSYSKIRPIQSNSKFQRVKYY